MKRIGVLMALCCLVLTGLAQKPSLNKAYNAFFEKDYIAAKEMIDLCVNDEKLKTKPQTFLYKGNIYFYLANEEYEKTRENASYVSQFPNAAMEAFDAFVTAKAMNKNVDAYQMLSPDSALVKIYPLLFVRGATLLVEGDHQTAIPILEKAIVSYEMIPRNVLEGELHYYYAYALEAANRTDEARANYEKAINDGSKNVSVYVRLIEGYRNEKNTEKMKELLTLANEKFPGNPVLYVSNVSYLYSENDTVEARKMLNAIPIEVYKDATSLVNVSNFFVQDKDYENGYRLLLTANGLTPNNYNVVYNLGVCTYYMAQDLFLKSNDLQINGKENEALKMKSEAERLLAEAEGYFVFVLGIEPNDLNILQALQSIYTRMQSPKLEEIEERIEALK